MRTRSALRTVAAAAERLRAAEELRRDAIRAAFDAGASLRQIAAEANVSHEQVRRIVGDSPAVAPYFVTVERRGHSPLETRLLVRASSQEAAGELATWLAERKRGGMFEATNVRRAAKHESAYLPVAYDDADI